MKKTSILKFNFMILFSLLTSSGCNELEVSQKGYFKFEGPTTGRSIASVQKPKLKEIRVINKKYNPTQFYLHCHIKKSKTAKNCYYKKLSSLINNLGVNPKSNKAREIEQYYSFEKIESFLSSNAKKTINSIMTPMLSLVSKRSEFCRQNSKHLLKRCLMQYTNQDSVSLVNILQTNNPKINGVEYLYFKDKIEVTMKAQLDEQYEILAPTL